MPEQLCVILNEGAQIDEVNATWGTVEIAALPEDHCYLLHYLGPLGLEELAEAMTSDRRVRSAEPNWLMETPEAVRQMVIGAIGGTLADFEDQAMGQRIGLEQAHALGRGEGVLVAVLDTGVDPNHELFVDRLAPGGYDCVGQDGEPWEEANGLDDDGDGLTDEGFGHGSMVAGLVALVAPEAEILPVRVLDDEGLTDVFRILMGLHYAMDSGAQVINMSFGVGTLLPGILNTYLALNLGESVIAVAGAGNENRETPPYFPAAFDEVFMVTALDSLDLKAEFADYHPTVLVAAPGVGLRSAYPGNDWALGAGCSFATPLVAGEAALLLGEHPEMSREQVMDRIHSAVDDIYHLSGNEPFLGKLGSGRIDLPRVFLSTGLTDFAQESQRRLRVWPNPSSSGPRFAIPQGVSGGKILIYDVSGRLIRSLSLGETSTLNWAGDDGSGRSLPAGLYWARLVSEQGVWAGDFVLLR